MARPVVQITRGVESGSKMRTIVQPVDNGSYTQSAVDLLELMRQRGSVSKQDTEQLMQGKPYSFKTLSWARSCLKKLGYVANLHKGEWSITELGKATSMEVILGHFTVEKQRAWRDWRVGNQDQGDNTTPEPPSEPSTATPSTNPRKVDHESRKEKVIQLHEQGMGTRQIADALHIAPTSISKYKTDIGISASSPPTKLWRDIQHATSTLGGAVAPIEQFAEQLSTINAVNATSEDIRKCILQLSTVTGAIRRLSGALKALKK